MKKIRGVLLLIFFLCSGWAGAQSFEFDVSSFEISQIDSCLFLLLYFCFPIEENGVSITLEKILFYSMVALKMAMSAYLTTLLMGKHALLKTMSP